MAQALNPDLTETAPNPDSPMGRLGALEARVAELETQLRIVNDFLADRFG